MGSLYMLEAHPGFFAAAVVTGGAASEYSSYQNIAKTPLRMFCGGEDAYGFYTHMRSLYNALKSIPGADVEYTEFAGLGHDIFNYTGNNTNVVDWMLEQRLK
jgi:predicted peptidase